MVVNCLNCNRNFEPEHPQQFWCSMDCAEVWKKKQNPIFSKQQEEEIGKIVRSELKKQISNLDDKISSLKEELGNHRHDSDGITSHNY